MRLSTPDQIREIERLTGLEFGISEELLMEAAGTLCAKETSQAFLPELSRGKLAVVCGPGNNGGDGLVLARHLYSQGYLSLEVFTVGEAAHRTPLFNVQLHRAEKYGLKITDLEARPEEISRLKDFKVIVDALYGTGLSRNIEGISALVIQTINATQNVVMAIDVPSGIHALNGKILGHGVRATMTVTLGLAKPGLMVGEGPEHAGRVRVVQIGFSRRLFREIAKTHFTFNERLARRWLPVRLKDSNKAQHGHLLVIAGKPGMWGAAALCSEAAYRMGVGYVSLAVGDEKLAESVLSKDIGSEVLVTSRLDSRLLEKKSAIVIGPGAGADNSLRELIERLANEKFKNVVVDADGLTALSEMKALKLPKSWVLTPHTGELARLLKLSSEEIENDRFHFANRAAKKFGCLVLLKGFRSLIADTDDRMAIVTAGNAALAKAGTGDVLSGMIGALLAQNVGSIQAAGTAAYIHGRLADEWLRGGNDIRTFMPRDLLSALPQLLGQLVRE